MYVTSDFYDDTDVVPASPEETFPAVQESRLVEYDDVTRACLGTMETMSSIMLF